MRTVFSASPIALGDLAVRRALAEVREHASLLLGQVGEGAGLLEAARVAEPIEDAARDRRVEQRPSGRHGSHGVDELARADPLQDVARRAGVDRVEQRLGVRVAGEHDDRRAAELGGDGATGVDPRPVRHPDVHHHDVGPELPRQPHGLVARGRTGHDREPRLGVEQRGQADADHLVVVGDEDPDRCGREVAWVNRSCRSANGGAPAS